MVAKCTKINNGTKCNLLSWSPVKIIQHSQGLKYLREKEKASKSAQAHITTSDADVGTPGDVLEVLGDTKEDSYIPE